jgi:hypothetical protein
MPRETVWRGALVALGFWLWAGIAWGQIQSSTDPPLQLPASLPRGNAAIAPDTDSLVPQPPVSQAPQDVLPAPVPGGAAPAFDHDSDSEYGGGMMGLGPNGLPRAPQVRLQSSWFPDAPVAGQNTNFEIFGEDFSASMPIWNDKPDIVTISTHVRQRSIDTAAVLPDTGNPYPSELWDIGVGLTYIRLLGDGWVTGGGVSLGSASDHPFATSRELNVGMNAFFRLPQGEHNAWLFGLAYSPTGELLFPMPIVAFSWQPSPQFHANIGLPFSVTYRPTKQLRFEASYMPIHTIHAKGSYHFTEPFSAFAAYDWVDEAYSLEDRVSYNERLFLYDQRVSGGLEYKIAPAAKVDFIGGYSFSRFSFEGTSWDTAGVNRIDLGNVPFVMLRLEYRFF